MPSGKGQRRRMSASRNIRIDIIECDVLVTDQRDGSVERPLMIMVHEEGELLATRLAFSKDLTGRGGFNA
jgi:hypothetical protein